MKIVKTFIALIVTLQCLSVSHAATNITYGPEWTFYVGPNIYVTFFDLTKRFSAIIKDKDPQVKITVNNTQYTYPDGFAFELTLDQGVIETKATPQALKQWQNRAAELQSHLFGTMAEMGINPDAIEGAGHLNIGMRPTFSNNPLLLRNFIVDFLNNPGIGVVLGHQPSDSRDAAHFSTKPQRTRSAFARELDKLDAAPARSKKQEFEDYHLFFAEGPLEALRKYVALGIRNGETDAQDRLEIRTLRPQASMEDFVKVAEIFDARIAFLKKNPNKIKFTDPKPIKDGYEALRQYFHYLNEAGLDYERYKSLMPPPWREIPLKDFLTPKEVREYEQTFGAKNKLMCSKILK